MMDVCVKNNLKFRFALFDIWFSPKENMCHIKVTHEQDFICALKANRLVALSEENYQSKQFISIENLPWQEKNNSNGKTAQLRELDLLEFVLPPGMVNGKLRQVVKSRAGS